MHIILNALTAGFALTAAVLWLMSTSVSIKSEIETGGGYPSAAEILDTAARQVAWNRWAAFASGTAAALLAFATIMPCCD